MSVEVKTKWNKILPTVWHGNAFDPRLYLFISPSGKTHIAEWIDNIGESFSKTTHSRNYKFHTLCNRDFHEYYPNTKKPSGWNRPSPYYDSLHNKNPDGFLDVTCPRCAKLKPAFREPSIEIDLRLYRSELKLVDADDDEYNHRQKVPHFHTGSQLSSNLIPRVSHDPERRCQTCSRICTTSELERRRKNILESVHHGWRNPRACENWSAGVYSSRQKAFRLTTDQLMELSPHRLNLIYQYLINNHDWEPDMDANFQVRVLKALGEKER